MSSRNQRRRALRAEIGRLGGLTKLRRWHDKVIARDTLHAPGAAQARAALQRCAQALDEFASHVYTADGDGS